MSGFPLWTLWGMGLSALGALIAVMLAFAALSPRLLVRLGLAGARLDLRLRSFIGVALAFMLLAGGFFLAGVPLESLPGATPTAQVTGAFTAVTSTPGSPFPTTTGPAVTGTAVPTRPDNAQTPQSGAFSGPPPGAETATTPADAGPSPDASATPQATTAPPSTGTPTPRPTTTPTSTPTPSPTVSPTPTLTPTPIEGETAVINTGSSTIWVHRSPGGQNLFLVRGGDTVILQPGHASQAGALWQEIMALDGTVGWVREEFLAFDGIQ